MTAIVAPVTATDPRIGRRSVPSLGPRVNLVKEPVFGCPACSQDGPMEVYKAAVRWTCGHTRDLPTGIPR